MNIRKSDMKIWHIDNYLAWKCKFLTFIEIKEKETSYIISLK